MENENSIIQPQYPAQFYTKRPNPTAILSPLYDCTFKGIFTQETEESYLALKSFISAIFNRKILNVSIKSNEPYRESKKQKNMIFDICVEFDDGEIIDIEMQAWEQNYDYGIRAEIQAARLLTNNARKGKKWESPKIYQISVLNFHYKKDDKHEMRWYTMTDNSGEKLSETLNVIFIDLVSIRNNSTTKPVEKLSSLEKWGLFFSYVDHEDKKDYINEIIKSEKGIMAADRIVKHMSKADSNWYIQNSIYTAECDYNTKMANAVKQGIQQGIQQGLAKGIEQGLQQKAVETAVNLLEMHIISDEQIAQSTGLTIKKVQELKKTL